MNVTKKLFLVLLPFTLVACKAKKEDAEIPPAPSEVELSSVSLGKCLNLEKLSRVLQDPNFSVPAALMTTNLKPIGDMPQARLNYFSYATFNYKVANVNDLGLFTQIRQKDCKTVQMLSASEEVLTYDVTSASENEISIKLKDKFRDTMIDAQKKALFARQQPYEITYKFLTPHNVMITEKYSTVDPICSTKTALSFEIRKDLHWESRITDLPQGYDIDTKYLSQVKDSVAADALTQVNSLETPENIPVDSIRAVMRAPIKEELKLCGQ